MKNNNENQIDQTTKSKSQLIREMNSKGTKPSEIAKALGIRYQFVNNVLTRDRDKKELETLRSQIEKK